MEEAIKRHERIVLQFSGGKDSLACLHLARPFWDRLTVVWVNTGDAFPETLAQMSAVRTMVPHFFEAKSDQPAQIARAGWPSDVVSVSATAFGRHVSGETGPILQGYPACCGHNIWAPMQAAIAALGATLIIRGVRANDPRRGREEPGAVIDGVEFCFPLWNWTAEDVFDCLKSKCVALPDHYRYTKTSLDCQHCTAYLDENAEKMRYISMMHPEVSKEVQKRLKTIRSIVFADVNHITKAVL